MKEFIARFFCKSGPLIFRGFDFPWYCSFKFLILLGDQSDFLKFLWRHSFFKDKFLTLFLCFIICVKCQYLALCAFVSVLWLCKVHFSYLFNYNELLSELKLLIYNKLMAEVLAEVKCAWQSVYNLCKLEIKNQMYKITLINQKQQNT